MKLPKELTTVTRLSILLTAISFVVLVILAFYLGMEYQRSLPLLTR
jgi:sensor histidine kinase regulating citrate/malate metabolism